MSKPVVHHSYVIAAASIAVAAMAVAIEAMQPAVPRFAVVSIKPCKAPDDPGQGGKKGAGGRIRWDPGRLEENCQTVSNLIRDAYLAYSDGKPWRSAAVGDDAADPARQPACTGCGDGLPPVSDRQFHQPIQGSPSWLNSDRYTIDARAETPATLATLRGPMMQAVLADRFKLKIHRQYRQVPVFDLTLRKTGPKLRPTGEGSCVPAGRWEPAALPSRQHPIPASATGCGFPAVSPEGLDFNGTTIANLCRLLSGWADRDIIDRTGLSGMFDFHFALHPPEPPEPDGNAAMFDAVAGALARAGLKLTPARAMGEFLVIDHIERPSGN